MENDSPEERLVPLNTMAERVGVRPQDLRMDAAAGTMPHVRVGKSGLLFDPDVVLAVLAERSRQSQVPRDDEVLP